MFATCLAPGGIEGRLYGGPCVTCANKSTHALDDTPRRGQQRRKAQESQEKQATSMKKHRSHGRPIDVLTLGTVVLVPVAEVDRHKTDVKHVPGVVVEVTEHFFYRVGVIGGILNDAYLQESLLVEPRTQPAIYGLQDVLANWKDMKNISLRAALAEISPTGGQGFTKCGCKGSCDSNSCKCKKTNVMCNSRCHYGNTACRNCK